MFMKMPRSVSRNRFYRNRKLMVYAFQSNFESNEWPIAIERRAERIQNVADRIALVFNALNIRYAQDFNAQKVCVITISISVSVASAVNSKSRFSIQIYIVVQYTIRAGFKCTVLFNTQAASWSAVVLYILILLVCVNQSNVHNNCAHYYAGHRLKLLNLRISRIHTSARRVLLPERCCLSLTLDR